MTHFASGVLYAPVWSHDGQGLLAADAEHDLWLVHRQGEKPVRVARDPVAEIRDAAFSPDGRWIAYSTTRSTGNRALHLYEIATARDSVISSPMESDRSPVFDNDGGALYFISQRNELPFVSDRGDEAAIATIKSDGVYGVALSTDALASVVNDPSRLMSQAFALPIGPAHMVSLEQCAGQLIAELRPPSLIDGELPGETASLQMFDLHAHTSRELVSDLNGHVLSADCSHVLYRREGAWRIASTRRGGGDAALSVAGLHMRVDPRAEWAAMFEHAWRLDRDLFFSKVMNGDNWQSVHDHYAPLVKLLGSRDDFLYLLRQLQGEIATSHAFIGGLDADDATPPTPTPRLGADFALDASTGLYNFARVYAGDDTRDRFRSPLAVPGLDVRKGDTLLAVQGHPLRAPMDPDSLLSGLRGEVTLSIARGKNGTPRDIRVMLLQDDLDLRQHDWAEANRQRVAARSAGRIGYIFVPDFDALGAQDFVRQAASELARDGLVLDVRWNSGGFLSQAILGILRRANAGVFVNREGALQPLPQLTAPFAMAVLTNAYSASDGDQFPFFFRVFGLGPVVGERSWGGVQGIKGPWTLMDGTVITIPKDSLASRDGHWLIENEGTAPDVAVSPGADEMQTGEDAMLDSAAAAISRLLAATPPQPMRAPPSLPAYPAGGNVPPASFGNPTCPGAAMGNDVGCR